MPSEARKPTDGYVARYVNRRFSEPISRFIVKHKIPLTPNQASFIAFLVGAAALPLYVVGRPIVAGILVQLSSILDGVDGELARLLNMSTRFGAFFDGILDRFVDIMAIVGASVYLAQVMPLSSELLVVMLLALSGTIMVSYLHIRSQHDLGTHPMFVGRVANLASRDVRLFILFLGSVSGYVLHALVAIAALTYLYVVAKFLELCYLSPKLGLGR